MKDTVLVLTQRLDEHADRVVQALKRRGARVVRFHTLDFPRVARVTVEIKDGELRGAIRLSDGDLDICDVYSVWYRRPEPPELPQWAPEVRQFAIQECAHTLDGLWTAIPAYMVSRPDRIRNASFKIPQLQWAKQAGFEVPKTLVTNDPDRALLFYEESGGDIVYKVLFRGGFEYGSRVIGAIYTSPVTREHLRYLERVEVAPCQFQEYVPKQVEVRATVFGATVLAVEIHSQATERTRHDWRRYDRHTPYRPHCLPRRIEECCARLVQNLGLEFGAIDLVLRPDGEYVFLKINPNGQWAWLEDETGMPFTETLVNLLLSQGQPANPG